MIVQFRHGFDDVIDALRHCFDSLVDGLMHYEGGGESEDKFTEKHKTSMQFFSKIIENRRLEGSKIEGNRCLEASWGVLARFGASLGAVA